MHIAESVLEHRETRDIPALFKALYAEQHPAGEPELELPFAPGGAGRNDNDQADPNAA